MWRTWMEGALFRIATIIWFAIASGIFTGLIVVTLTDLPQVESLENYRPHGVTTLRDIRGEVLHEFFYERRMPVSLMKVPPLVRNAFLAAEDWRFYKHFGVDVPGLTRALFKNVWERRYAEGASTITQQLAKVLFLTPEKTIARKLKEALLAFQIERRYTKDEILQLYLNQIYLGSGCYGVEAAARTYFGKGIGELEISEAALLAALPKAPALYSPFQNPEKARERRDLILGLMYERRLISRGEWDHAREDPIPEKPVSDDRIESYFAAHVLKLLTEKFGEDQVFRGRMEVQTTLDLHLQKSAEEAVQNGILAYAKRHGIPSDRLEKLPQSALLAIDIANGEIRAMVGGRSFAESQFNRATQALRQPGSAFKPIVFTAALEHGFTQSTLVEDRPIDFRGAGKSRWSPENYDQKYDGDIPMRIALELSKNVPTVRIAKALGVPSLRHTALRLGIRSPIASDLSSALGSSSVSLTELATAYATFANGGIRPHLQAIRSVQGDAAIDLWTSPPPSQSVLDPRIAYIMTDLLTGVIRFGTGQFASDLSCSVAGKTGTTDDFVDALFAGFNSELAVVTWIGHDDRRSLGNGETGARAAGPIWKEFMQTACRDGATEFLPPSTVMMVDVDHSSGLLPGRFCTDIVTEAFLQGTEPTQSCMEEGLTEGPMELDETDG